MQKAIGGTVTYNCYRVCPECGGLTLRLVYGTPQNGLWRCEGYYTGDMLEKIMTHERCEGRDVSGKPDLAQICGHAINSKTP